MLCQPPRSQPALSLVPLRHSPSLWWWMIVAPTGEAKIAVPIRRLGVDTGIWRDRIPMSVVATVSGQSDGCVGVIAPWSLEWFRGERGRRRDGAVTVTV